MQGFFSSSGIFQTVTENRFQIFEKVTENVAEIFLNSDSRLPPGDTRNSEIKFDFMDQCGTMQFFKNYNQT